jgi:malic enzyme
MLFKEFADIDSWPICLATQYTDAIIQAVMSISPSFGGIFMPAVMTILFFIFSVCR